MEMRLQNLWLIWWDQKKSTQTSKPARAHRLPKVHKEILSVPKFRPTIYTTRTSHCFLGKYLESLLYPLTTNELSLKDYFDAASRI